MGSSIQLQCPTHYQQSLLLSFPLFLLLIFSFSHVTAVKWDGIFVTESDFQALKAIKREFIDLNGVLQTWNDTSPGACSGWTGIKCAGGQVIAIQLPWKGLGGRLSEQIGQLKSLRRLSLHDNVLVGPIPTSLGFLPNLRGIYLFNNRLSGSIPPSIGNCVLLQTLDLSNNQLTGIIPRSLSNSTRLYRLNLSFNSISGEIPNFLTQTPTLNFLSLNHNNLSGSVPDTWTLSNSSSSSYQIKSLILDHNFLSGKIPSSLTNLTQIEDLSLSHNRFTGQIPENIGNITRIISLDLSNNNLTGEIPISITNIQNLTSLDLSYNNLSGNVPASLSKKFNSSSFTGNIQLCGYSLSTPCPSSPSPAPAPAPQLLPSSSSSYNHRKLSTKDIILIVAGILLIILLILCCILLCCLFKKKPKKGKTGGPGGGLVSGIGLKAISSAEVESAGETGGKLVHFDGPFVFTADDLLCATAEIMGKSTYGTAYKATLEDNNQVAVKRLREKITKGQKEFEIEVAQLGKIRHPNILSMRAYYLGPKGEKLLVYDYMPNGSLASFLHARGPETSIPWSTRMGIAIGITRGVCHLHTEEKMVHGNITSSNILLDEENNPKIADVGLSRLMTNAANTDAIATAGAMGYRAPELSKLKNASTKSDVFSVGVIILELLTGKSPSEATSSDGLDLPQWVASIVKEEWTNEVFDVELLRDASDTGDELLNTLKLALHCVDPAPANRPDPHQLLLKLEEMSTPAPDHPEAHDAAATAL